MCVIHGIYLEDSRVSVILVGWLVRCLLLKTLFCTYIIHGPRLIWNELSSAH